jgi:predicted Ser/Thr protein kinase
MSEQESDQSMEKKCPECGAAVPSGALEGLCPACLLKQGVAAETITPHEGSAFQPPGLDEVAKLFPQLEILGFIGKGGMGAVYKARQPALDRLVALKILPAQTVGGPAFAERFNREARALAKLNHPNIVAIYEFGQAGGLSFFVMEFVDGLNLRQLEQAGKLSPREALQIVPQICEALQFAHDEGIVHRDIKPANILLDKKGRVKIADFGIAKIMGSEPQPTLTETRGVLGTPQYMAPEQVEKPQAVDHRADIFSLGVVFYEMLTGELPLGKFAPPSSRMGVQVDVRLDEVVLRSLEKEPGRRYQHASQVKTAVETIAGSAAPPPPPSAEALARALLAADYSLNIRSCARRGWKLVRSNFWPLVGVTALVLALFSLAGSVGGLSVGAQPSQTTSVLAVLVWGPLMGGLYSYFLKRIRQEQTTIETAFSGFSKRFLHLFLGSFVTGLLTGLGFFCLVLPGIYLLVAWIFTLPLVIDQGLDFWTAMEVSRKVVTKHWWKLLGLMLVLMLLFLAGIAALIIGVFVMMPVMLATLMYAYEDIFGTARLAASQQPAGFGPSGTVVTPASGPAVSASGRGFPRPVTIGLVAAVVVIVAFIAFVSAAVARARAQRARELVARTLVMTEPPAAPSRQEYGPVFERVIELNDPGRRALNLASGNYVTSLPSRLLDFGLNGANTMRTAGVDLYAGGRALAAIGNGDSQGAPIPLTTLDWRILGDEFFEGQDIVSAEHNDIALPVRTLEHAEASISGTNLVAFITRDGTEGILQITGQSQDPPTVTIRYRLVERVPGSVDPESAQGRKLTRRRLAERLEAASTISSGTERDDALAWVARDAAKAGEFETVKSALQTMINITTRDEVARESALLLGRRGLGKQAIEIARGISNITTRDEALSELAK